MISRDSFLILDSQMFVNAQVLTIFISFSYSTHVSISRDSFFNFGIPDVPPCYVRQCSLVLIIVLDFFKCLGFHMHFISLYGALSLHNCSSSGSQVFAHLGRINYDCTSSNNSTNSYIIYKIFILSNIHIHYKTL